MPPGAGRQANDADGRCSLAFGPPVAHAGTVTTEELYYRAAMSGDNRFDGWVYVGVTSTGIYCRPSCPAKTPKRANMRFFRTAGSAQAAGFRACKRCRPEV